MEAPRFTIVTPSFNQGAYIERTIDSVLSQGYPNLEYIVVDGGSTDNSVDIIRKYERHLAYWVSEPDRGQSHAINKGMARANGTYLTWLNSDDWYLPGALAEISDMFAQNPNAGVVVGAGRIVDEQGKVLHFSEPKEPITVESLYGWMRGGNFMQPSSAFRASAWTLVGGLDESVHIAMDLDLWLRMARAGVQFATTLQLLSDALSHPGAKTTAYRQMMRLDCSIVIIRHGGEVYVRPILEKMVNNGVWYRKSYQAIFKNRALRILKAFIPGLPVESRPDQTTSPPWANN